MYIPFIFYVHQEVEIPFYLMLVVGVGLVFVVLGIISEIPKTIFWLIGKLISWTKGDI